MSSVLFTRKAKPFSDVSALLPSKVIIASKGNASKKPAVHGKSGLSLLLEDDDDGDFVVADVDSSNEKMITKKCELDDDDDDNDNDVDHARTSRRVAATSNRCNSNNTVVHDIADEESCSGGEDEMLQQCRQLSARLESQKKKIKSDLSSQAVPSLPTSCAGVKRSIAAAAADDYLRSSRVLSAAERLRQKDAFSVGRTAYDAQKTPAMAISSLPAPAATAPGQQSSLRHLKLVTKVNGLHEWKWSFAPDDSFSKFKEKFQAIYLVPLQRFKLLIDGEVIDDRQTCNDLGIRSGDVIDVQMDRDVYSEAIKNAAGFRELTSAQPAPSDKSAAVEDPLLLSNSAVTDGIKLKTRLNGIHERRWVISRSASFDQFRQTFSATYGLPSTAAVKLVFDGDSIPGSATPISLDMDDDNMIDVKIDKALYEAAVKVANSNRAAVLIAEEEQSSFPSVT